MLDEIGQSQLDRSRHRHTIICQTENNDNLFRFGYMDSTMLTGSDETTSTNFTLNRH